MDVQVLTGVRDAAWLYAAAPVLALAALVLTVRLRLPQLLRLPAAFRGLRGAADASGAVAPGVATIIASVGSVGAAAAVGAATAVSLGGAGALAWVWLFAFLLAPLRMADTILARTDAPGAREPEPSGSLAARLLRDGAPASRAVGWLLAITAAFGAFAFVGGVHGHALADVAGQLVPKNVRWLLGGVAAVAALLAAAGPRRAATVAGWLGVVALAVLVGTLAWVAAENPARTFGVLGRTIGEAFQGAPSAEPFTGAFAGEIAFAAVLYVLPPLAATTGIDGAVHGLARARSTRAQASVALLGPLVYALTATVVVMALVGTGAFFQPVEDERPITEVRVYRMRFETASQRIEPERLHEGYVRIRDGKLSSPVIEVATERGLVEAPEFRRDGAPADVALRIRSGRVASVLQPNSPGALTEAPGQPSEIVVRGEMLPRGGGLLRAAAAGSDGSSFAARLLLAALLALAAVAASAWGFGAARSLPSRAPIALRAVVALLPALGLVLYAVLGRSELSLVGSIAGAALAVTAALALILRSGAAAKLVR